MERAIGIAVQPKTHLTPPPNNGQAGPVDRAHAAVTGAAELVSRATHAAIGGSNQGFTGALAAAYAGHTVSYGVNEARNNPTTVSVGYSPEGVLNNLRMGYEGSRGNPGAHVPGANHNESGITADPNVETLTVPVSAGLYARFEAYQQGVLDSTGGFYSWRPNSPNGGGNPTTENCGTDAVNNMRDFINHAQNHQALMGELRQHPTHQQAPTQVHQEDAQALQALDAHVTQMHGINQARQAANRGNQGPLTAYVTGAVQAHDQNQAQARAAQDARLTAAAQAQQPPQNQAGTN